MEPQRLLHMRLVLSSYLILNACPSQIVQKTAGPEERFDGRRQSPRCRLLSPYGSNMGG